MKPSVYERIRAVLVFSLKLMLALPVLAILAGLPVLVFYYLDVYIGWFFPIWALLLWPLLYYFFLCVTIADVVIGWVASKEWRERREQRRNQRLEQEQEERRQQEEKRREWYERYQEEQRQRYVRSRPPQAQRSERGAEYDRYLNSEAWREKAEEAKQRAGHRCQLCNKGNTVLHVHHRTYERLREELPDDLIVLCAGCHSKFHDKVPNRSR